ncbi:N-formylglutamate amidohydrolase [Sphingobacterium sp. LRF_L2]|uniref:N-formylglutamate amidohydrolase n=1 Tax=Sphingobacterium sp. LRF_L2 TaxID=3369421 RepID=UPI003F63D2BA
MPALFEFQVRHAESPFWTFAIHDGHQVSPAILPYLQLDETQRLREEDPYTGSIAELPVNQFLVSTSRFQLDINRAPDDAIYLHPDQAWGLTVWKKELPKNLLQLLYHEHELIYKQIDHWIQETIKKHGYFVIFDIHSYNAKRGGPDDIVDKEKNPQINLGTAYNNPRWQAAIACFLQSVAKQNLFDTKIDIRENVKFKGGFLAQHLIRRFGEDGFVLSIEFRKDFMDEWTGIPYMPIVQSYKQLLMHTLKDLQEEVLHGLAR